MIARISRSRPPVYLKISASNSVDVCSPSRRNVATASTAFHTYVVEWTPTLMRFSYDGRVCFEHAWTPTNVTGSAPFDRPFNLVLSQAWGSLWNAPTAQTSGASTLVVDWVRAWQ